MESVSSVPKTSCRSSGIVREGRHGIGCHHRDGDDEQGVGELRMGFPLVVRQGRKESFRRAACFVTSSPERDARSSLVPNGRETSVDGRSVPNCIRLKEARYQRGSEAGARPPAARFIRGVRHMSSHFTQPVDLVVCALRNSVGRVVIGLIVIIAMIVLLFWNEGRAVQTRRVALAEAMARCLDRRGYGRPCQ